MKATLDKNNCFLTAFDRREHAALRRDPSWLTPIRNAAIARFAELGFPTPRHEDWRFTNLAALSRTDFAPLGTADPITAAVLAEVTWDAPLAAQLVFANGAFAPALSRADGLPGGVLAGSLAALLRDDPDRLEPHLARTADYHEHPFTALNTALLTDGAFVHVPRGLRPAGPIHVIHVTVPGREPAFGQPRNLFLFDADVEAKVVESFVTLGEGRHFTNAVTELVLGENAIVEHAKIQAEGPAALHVGTLEARQGRSSVLHSHCVTFGAELTRHNLHVALEGDGADCLLNGLYVVAGRQHVDNHLRVEHAAPHCTSRENFRGILDGQSHGVFTGRIVVHKEAQKTDGKQSNMNLLLSPDAVIDTKPQLEIFADDVRCTHGATIGEIDDDAIFYLRSRGIAETAARALLVYAFARASLEPIGVEPLRRQLEARVLARLPGGDLFREAV